MPDGQTPSMSGLPCVVLGGGGHAKVLIESLRLSAGATPRVILDADRSLWGTEVLGVPVLGGDDRLSAVVAEGITAFVVGVGGVGDNRPRRRLFELAVSYGLTPVTARHPSAIVSPSCGIGAGTVLFPLAVVNAGVSIGMNVIVNTGAIVEHDCRIADHVHLATGARLTSGVTVGAEAHLGAGSVVRQGITIGDRAIVGAGAVVVRDVQPGTIVVGVPARPLRKEAAS